MIIKSVGVRSVGRILGCLYAVIGLIVGAIISLISLAGIAVAGEKEGAAGLLFGVGAVVLFPIVYGTMGFIGGVIMAAIYNVVAAMAGGIEINLERTAGDYALGTNRAGSLREDME